MTENLKASMKFQMKALNLVFEKEKRLVSLSATRMESWLEKKLV